MSRDGSGVYTKPFPDVVGATTIASAVYNGFVNDVAADLNAARPVVAGGTGASNAVTALFNLGAEAAAQQVTNYDTQIWQPGSFWSATTATSEPVDGQAFSGVAYINEALANPPTNANVTVEARSLTDGRLWIRRKVANVWGAWTLDTATQDAAIAGKVAKGGDTMTGLLVLSADPGAPLGAATKQYVDALSTATGTALSGKVAKGGDTMTGLLVLSADPGAPLGAATKQYVDNRAVRYDAAQGLATGQAAQARANIAAALRGHLWGLTLSTAGSVNVFGIAAGECANSTNLDLMVLGSAYTKSTSAWAVGSGNGALDTGALSNTWYHVFIIKRPDTGVVDVLFSLSATAPTLPANYTLFRRIGSLKLESSLWRAFIQNGDDFIWDVAVLDVNGTACPTTPTLTAITVPPGVVTQADLFVELNGSATLLVYDPARSSQTVNSPAGSNVSVLASQAAVFDSAPIRVYANTSSQVTLVASSANTAFISTRGWTDTRGRLS